MCLRRAAGGGKTQQQHAGPHRQRLFELRPRSIFEFNFCFHK
jgi:hypothetical protein